MWTTDDLNLKNKCFQSIHFWKEGVTNKHKWNLIFSDSVMSECRHSIEIRPKDKRPCAFNLHYYSSVLTMIEEVWAEVQPMWFTVAISSLNVRLPFHVIILMLSVSRCTFGTFELKGRESWMWGVYLYVCMYPYLWKRTLFFEAFASALWTVWNQ